MTLTYTDLADLTQDLWQLTISPAHIQVFGQYYQQLMVLNQQINLCRIPDEAAYIERHLLNSLCLWPLLRQLPPGTPVLDIGSGGGFPLLPLAIVRPDLAWHSMEATQKKVRCLQQLAESLGLSIDFHPSRTEAMAHKPEHKGQYAVVTARAVASLDKLAQWASPFLMPGTGRLLALKGQRTPEELAQARPVLKRLKLTCLHTHQWTQAPSLEQTTVVEIGFSPAN
jgi:16S rRNA (guanine527-N7)-methyltransferase